MSEIASEPHSARSWVLFDLFIGLAFGLLAYVEFTTSSSRFGYIFAAVTIAYTISAWMYYTGRRKPVGNLLAGARWGVAFAVLVVVGIGLWLYSVGLLAVLP